MKFNDYFHIGTNTSNGVGSWEHMMGILFPVLRTARHHWPEAWL
jgi:hypothetical protein